MPATQRIGWRPPPRLFLIVGLLGGSGCQAPRMPPATGSPLDIVVLGEAAPPEGLAVLGQALSQSFPPLGAEDPGFRLSLAATGRVPRKPREKNLLILGRLEAPRTWEPLFGDWLSTEARGLLSFRGAGWFVFRDVWARGQEVMLVVARGREGLDSLLVTAAPDLRRHWHRSVIERSFESVRADTATVPARQLRDRGFVLAVPGSYRLSPNPSGWADAVEMVRASPSRTVSVFWLDDVEASRLEGQAFLLGLQQDAMWRLHRDEVVEGTSSFTTPDWDPARRVLCGSWQNRRDVAGGPFITHFVYDVSRRRLYGVQALLFAPGRRKAVHMVELEALLRTFHVVREP